MIGTPLQTLAIGGAGAVAADLLGLPAAPLLGAALATFAATGLNVRLYVPNVLWFGAILVIGIALGSGVQADILSSLPNWGSSLLLLSLSIVATLYLSSWILRRFWHQDHDTAVLASAPGTMSLVMALAAEGRGEAKTVLVMQMMRLLGLTAIVPLVVSMLGVNGVGGIDAPAVHTSALVFLLLALPGALVSVGLMQVGFPAAFLVGGMLASAITHASGHVQGQPPAWIVTLGFMVTGTALGSRFSGLRKSDIYSALGATVASVGTAAVVSACFAALTSWLADIPFGQAWVSFAPGGVEAMSAIGLALGYDPAYVATHHLFRIFVLISLLTFALRKPR